MKVLMISSLACGLVLFSCSTLETGIDPIDFSTVKTVTERSGGCALFPPGTVDAIAPAYEVEILESNSDFINEIWLVSPVELFIGTDDDWGTTVSLPPVTPHTEYLFEIRVNDPSNIPTGDVWQTGPASRNADGVVHAQIRRCQGRTFVINFEDISAPGWTGDEPNYVDAIFEVRPQ